MRASSSNIGMMSRTRNRLIDPLSATMFSAELEMIWFVGALPEKNWSVSASYPLLRTCFAYFKRAVLPACRRKALSII
jgi:hypothetical protein